MTLVAPRRARLDLSTRPSSDTTTYRSIMAYQVLARKCRPQDFSSLIGQEPIVTALRNALTEARIAQAYLFSGIRGVGKTSAARVLAKALNCETGPSADPCNDCQICREITTGADLDVIEVDAATYSKVEQVRELTESLRYGPARDRYKVVILDEVHRLSRQAFDALLKIIEEPPPHLVFIFATTEIEAVPATILSRCQEFNFRRVPTAVLAEHLRRISETEEINASDAALRLIARAGEGSVRDSVALLDQMATFGAGTITDDDAVRLLGGLDLALFHDLLAAMLAGDSGAVVTLVRQVETEGRDPRHVHTQFLGYCRDGLHLALGGDAGSSELPEEDAARLAVLCRGAGYENLLRLTHQLLASEPAVRRSEAGILALEIAWLRAAELPKLTRVEELLAGAAVSSRPPQPAPAPPARSAPPPRSQPRQEDRPAKVAEPDPPPAPAPRHSSEPPPPDPSDPGPGDPLAPPVAATPQLGGADALQRFLDAVTTKKQPLGVRLRAALDLRFEDGALSVEVPRGDTSLAKALERDTNLRVLEDALAAVWGAGSAWRIHEVDAPAASAEETTDDEPAVDAETAGDPRVQTVLDIFGGKVVDPR
ncbi:MAG: DNA polymerase III subunit gamma/tau [Acidobacteria bacterium]|nr:DNA polymerase III subunit gamma/tau [Acidobacteriota bacterium]